MQLHRHNKIISEFLYKGKRNRKKGAFIYMNDIREFLSRRPLLFDGGMGTYYKAAPGI